MCTQGMHWGLLYILQGIKPRTFEELATRAYNMELSIASRGSKDFPIYEVKKDRKETKGAEKVVKSTVKESIVVNTTPLKFSKRKEGRAEKNDDGSVRRRLTLKESQEKVYPFSDSDIVDMLEQLLEKQLIQLLECKRLEQVGKVDDPNYCKYHWVISHLIEKYFVLKELILRLAREKKIELDLEEVAQRNHGTVTIMSEAFSKRLIFEQRERLVQFGTFELIVVQFHQEVAPEDSKEKERSIEEDDESILLRSLEDEGDSKDLSRFNVDDLLSLPQETKTTLINALSNSVESSLSAPTATYESTSYCMSIDFSDEDLLLGSKLHIRSFQSALFHVIDSRTTYKLLLGRPWIHENGVVTSKLHQCFKFYQDGVKKVEVDSNPFSEDESHFADAKFYLKNDNSPEAVPVEIPLVNREDNLQLKSPLTLERVRHP
ncbi:retrotransposon gag protein [Cucumis melo var. makuwa]|uniref:Retrotransposon gag protein n=1 Tax=Cucumis melo var. makuwa TaxID=1194695 RepID=A0A5D3CTQ5_CUCMM|nr:retrotransposon gag protein [Cucumis melo var. makuwa]TYK14374.1 retrotransposon gag protein [Cucumis melo var. makuwa]